MKKLAFLFLFGACATHYKPVIVDWHGDEIKVCSIENPIPIEFEDTAHTKCGGVLKEVGMTYEPTGHYEYSSGGIYSVKRTCIEYKCREGGN